MPFRETQIPHLSVALLTLLLIYSCTSLKILPAEKPKGDPFSRVYAVPFKDFHPKLNQALQKYAREKPGNSFQVTRLGSDLVIIQGSYQKEPNQARLSVVITTKPPGLGKNEPGNKTLRKSRRNLPGDLSLHQRANYFKSSKKKLVFCLSNNS